MSEFRYKQVGKFDFKKRFKAIFNGNTGFYMRSGILERDEHGNMRDTGVDPFMASFPELIDIGIMERCLCSNKCNVDCYQKACERTGDNMSLEHFKWIIEQCKEKVFQVALGGAGDPDTHDNFKEILEVCARANIVPNFTTSGIALNEEKVKLCKEYCGAVAVSEHNADYTDTAVKRLLENGVKTNIHYVLSNKSIDRAIDILNGKEYREGINAVVFLLYKPVGLGKEENVLQASDGRVKEFFHALDNRKCSFKVGFDSCSCSGLLNFSSSYSKDLIDFCEGGRFSMYISADMKAMPCSFANQDKSWWYQLDNEHTIRDAWESEIFEKFRKKLNTRCIGCKDRHYCGGGCPLMDSINLCDRRKRQYNMRALKLGISMILSMSIIIGVKADVVAHAEGKNSNSGSNKVEAQKDGAYWIEDDKGIKSDWYYVDPDNPKGDRWIKDYGYWYYIDVNNKMVVEPLDKEHVFNVGSTKEIPYGALIEEGQVIAKEKSLNNCTYLEIKREDIKKYDKVIVLLHGLCGVKEAYKYYGAIAATNKNTLVIVPELYGHELDKVGDIPNVIVNTSENLERILQKYHIRGNCELDIVGCSLGGMIGAYFVENSTYKVDKLSLLISTVDFKDLEHDIFFKKYKNGADIEEADKEKVLKELEKINVTNTKDTKVRLYNTVSDYYMDYEKVGNKVEELRANGCDIWMYNLGYEGHTVTKKEFLKSIEWLME